MIEWNDDVAMAIENRIDAQVLRIDDIERKQAKRFPLLLERLDRLEKELVELKKTEYFRSGTAVPVTKDSAEGGSW